MKKHEKVLTIHLVILSEQDISNTPTDSCITSRELSTYFLTDQLQAFGEIKNYYNDITHNNLDLIRSLKEEVRPDARHLVVSKLVS